MNKQRIQREVVRYTDKDIHGYLDDGDMEFVYISAKSPPINFI